MEMQWIGRYARTVALWALLLACLLSAAGFGGTARSETAERELWVEEKLIRPGLATIIHFILPKAMQCDLTLETVEGETFCTIADDMEGRSGENMIYWNATWRGKPIAEGSWALVLTAKKTRMEARITIGPMAPCLIGVALTEEILEPGDAGAVQYYATEAGSLKLTLEGEDGRTVLAEQEAEKGEGRIAFQAGRTGDTVLGLTLTDAEGISSETALVRFRVLTGEEAAEAWAARALAEQRAATVFTPAYGSPMEGKDTSRNYWTTAMDITDEAAVWAALTAPITVIDNGKGEKAQIILRSEPNAESEGVASITCVTQGVHVLERGEAWSLVECYSSSFYDSAILNWNVLAQGYVPTEYLKEITPNQELGYVVDKLTQRLYVFMEGKLYSTLMVSTGLSNARQPYNETRSGEFLMVSRVGTFPSDNLRCGMAIRFNKGDLIHEVPYVEMEDGSPDYHLCEPKLGSRASHGCIRVQRRLNAEGVNMAWIWSHYQKNTKLIIWEDWQGRQIPIPEDDTLLYYNPRGGRYYHSAAYCDSVSGSNVVFTPFSYGQLEEKPYAKLKWCQYCTPLRRRSVLEEINARHDWDGDHDPVLTEARESCPRRQN